MVRAGDIPPRLIIVPVLYSTSVPVGANLFPALVVEELKLFDDENDIG